MNLWKALGLVVTAIVLLAVLALGSLHLAPSTYQVAALADENKLTAISSLVYTVLTFGMFIAIVFTLFAAVEQLTAAKRQLEAASAELVEVRRAREATFIMELCRWYGSKEMHEALRAVHNEPPDKFKLSDSAMQNHRRLVSDFWNMVGAIVQAGLVDANVLKARFPYSPMSVAGKLFPLETHVIMEIDSRDDPLLKQDMNTLRRNSEAKVKLQPFM